MALAAAAAAWCGSVCAETVVVTVNEDAPIGEINPNIYGQFVEHLGRGIYGGIWVGADSSIPNEDGYRLDVLGALKDLNVPLMRWPGGCFADRYHWRDGVGEDRKKRINASWGGVIEPNSFGTHEFFNLAEKLDAETYLNFNVASGTPQEAADWLEYITSDSEASLAEERRVNGREEPWKVDYFSIGNETWGCGGNMRADYYADLYAQFATFLTVAGAEQPKRIVSGSHEGNIDYSRTVLEHQAVVNQAEGVSVHFYTLPTSDWSDKGDATGFPVAEWFSTIERTLRMEKIVEEQLEMIDALETDKEFRLYVDEWGMWTNQEEGAPNGSLYQQNTIRDAVVAALNLNIFHRNADRIEMSNIAQMINVLQAMILTKGADMVLTPTYHVYHMYKPFQGATALGVEYKAPAHGGGKNKTPLFSASAAKTEQDVLIISLVNADPENTLTVNARVGEGYESVTGETLTADAMDAHNDFDAPGAVAPVGIEAVLGNGLEIELPAKSVTVLRLQ